MALPEGLAIGTPVHYLPGPFDTTSWNRGNPGPVAAIVTWIDEANEQISMTIFQDGKPPAFRTGILYVSNGGDTADVFKLQGDPMPAQNCTTDVSDLAITDTQAGTFTLQWTAPDGAIGQVVYYRLSGQTVFSQVNQPGNLQGQYLTAPAGFRFDDLPTGDSIDFIVKNLCANSVLSVGVQISGTPTTPL